MEFLISWPSNEALRILDKNPDAVLLAFFLLYCAPIALDISLEWLNRTHMFRKASRVPYSFEGFVDPLKLRQMCSYTADRSRVGTVNTFFTEGLMLLFLTSGILPAMDGFLMNRGLGVIGTGLLFLLIAGAFQYLIELPYDYYVTFVIEDQYGFNHSSVSTWIIDHVKSVLVSVLLLAPLLGLILWIIPAFPLWWWLIGFIAVSLFQLVMMVIYPVVIAPIFNKFEPLQDPVLAEKIRDFMERGGVRVKGIYQMDGSRRSGHTNAYFTGMGSSKRIVLYDTLIASHPHEEILAVLGHEIGHYKGNHIFKSFLLMEALLLIGFYLTWIVMEWQPLFTAFGFDTIKPHAGLFLVSILWGKVAVFVQPVYLALSRHFEREADAFAVDLQKTPHPMTTALKRLAVDNLSNLFPHPYYKIFNYSHPPLVERVAALEERSPARMSPNPAPQAGEP